MQIRILGDFAPTGDLEYAVDPAIYRDAHLILANCEVPFPVEAPPRPKDGKHLRGNPRAITRCLARGMVMSMANNHAMDFGWDGVEATRRSLREAGIATVGVGISAAMAGEALVLDVGGCRVGIVACCEVQFGGAGPRAAGVNPLNGAMYRSIARLRHEVDLVVASVHGAAEMCPWPSPEWQLTLRALAEAGAAIVHGHHSHIPQGYERYGDALIFYGLGNFVANAVHYAPLPNATWSVAPVIRPGDPDLDVDFSAHTLVLEQQEGTVVLTRPSRAEERSAHRKYMQKANAPLHDPVMLAGLWQEFAVREYHLTYARWLAFAEGNPRTTRLSAGERWSSLRRGMREAVRGEAAHVTRSTRRQLLNRYHLFACDSHRQAIATALGVLAGELEDLRSPETAELANEMMPWSREAPSATRVAMKR